MKLKCADSISLEMYLSARKERLESGGLFLAYRICPPPPHPRLPHSSRDHRNLFLLGLTAQSQGVSGGEEKVPLETWWGRRQSYLYKDLSYRKWNEEFPSWRSG